MLQLDSTITTSCPTQEKTYNMQNINQKYDPFAAEQDCQKIWQQNGAFAWDSSASTENDYVIDTPPPTVSGSLHVGHVYSYTQADIIARYFRMSGKNVLYPIGWDDNGLPTERLVEKVKKVRGGNMSREEFVAVCSEVIPKYEDEFRNLFSRLGLSVDWSREYQTISPYSRAISQMSFLDLFQKGLIEQRLEPSLWDPADRTAIAQAEVDELEREGVLNYLEFEVAGESYPIEIATTRPELLAGCGAIMIHPNHPRAKELKDKKAITPLFHVKVPFIEDEKVDPDKGSGMVMCCTFGDISDIEWYKNYDLPLRIVLDHAGKVSSDIIFNNSEWVSENPELAQKHLNQISGLKADAAREKIIELLDADGALKRQEHVSQIIPVAERSGAPLEIIVTPQWFIKTLEYKDEILRLGQKITWYPGHMYNRFSTWVEGLKWDWCISRQRHFGVPIPAWISKKKGEVGKVLLPNKDQLPVDPLVDLPVGYNEDEVEPIRDVLDTWATSSVTPSLISGAVSGEFSFEDSIFDRITPSQMRPQAHEIIRTWAFYTIVKSMHHHGGVPWNEICISGWCRAKDGSKMSKSKGNIIDPIRLIDESGVDAVRYWTSTSRLGNDTVLDPNTLKQGKKLVNKLWNATKLVAQSLEGAPTDILSKSHIGGIEYQNLHLIDQWMIGELATCIEQATKLFEQYEYAHALNIIERFFWNTFCDNYLELVKWRIYSEGTEKEHAQISMKFAIDKIFRLFGPFIPYVTEVLYQNIRENNQTPSLHSRGNWPIAIETKDSGVHFKELLPELMSAIRKLKSSMGVSIKKDIKLIYIEYINNEHNASPAEELLRPIMDDVCATLNIDDFQFSNIQPDLDVIIGTSYFKIGANLEAHI